MQPVGEAMPIITRYIDRSILCDLRLKSGMLILMDAEARTQWAKHLRGCYQQNKRYTHNG